MHCCTADSTTDTPTLTQPEASSTIGPNDFNVEFTLPEAAAAGTVQLTLTRSGGSTDTNSPQVITFGSAFETAATHSMSVAELTGAVAASPLQASGAAA